MTSSSDKFSISAAGTSQFRQMRGYNTSKDIVNNAHVQTAKSVLVCTGIYNPEPNNVSVLCNFLFNVKQQQTDNNK